MKEKRLVYEKPSLKVVKVELNECIANSTIKVMEGAVTHEGLNTTSNLGSFEEGKILGWEDNWRNPSANGGW